MVVTQAEPVLPDLVARDSPDFRWVLAGGVGESAGSCSLWWRNTPAYQGHHVGIFGHYAARDEPSARQVLDYVCAELASRGCSIVVGPMDGNTWGHYRLVTDAGDEPPFFMEPSNPAEWPDHFLKNGFAPIAHYFSALNSNLSRRLDLARVTQKMAARDIAIRAIRPEQLEGELRSIHSIATVAFQNNFLYTRLPEQQFVDQYRALSRYVPMDLVLIAEWRCRPIGFVFAVPDFFQIERGRAADTIIVKSLGVLPDRSFAGLGNVLLGEVERRACELGYSRAIYALVRDHPHLKRMSSRYARTIRRYALFAKVIR